ncbi:TAXI family TRAP transporter solute-binding subunit [Streptomyces sp. NPDC093109]|uniref:TAXI family TRAP transporter solute-binding subunit n=1 Tax=Streptomyces sp. NPDC093109 TaxID=3154977 RepID=UPI003450A507
MTTHNALERRRLLSGGGAALALLLGGCSADGGTVRRLRLATGVEGGPYNAFGRALAVAVAESGQPLRVVPVTTSASVGNLRKLATGEAQLALAIADVSEDAVLGRGTFAGAPVAIAALARVYVNYTHLAVPAAGPVRTVPDLAGRSVATGPDGSGVRVVAGRVLRAAGLTGRRAVRERRLSLADSAAGLRAGTVDALCWSGGVSTPSLTTLARRLPLRFLPLDGYVPALRATYGPLYSPATIPVGAYGLDRPVGTIGVGNYLLARPDVPASVVRELLPVVFGRRRELLREVTAGARLEPRFAISTGSVPLHPGAVAYYRSVYG